MPGKSGKDELKKLRASYNIADKRTYLDSKSPTFYPHPFARYMLAVNMNRLSISAYTSIVSLAVAHQHTLLRFFDV
jgi:hypothetical protein